MDNQHNGFEHNDSAAQSSGATRREFLAQVGLAGVGLAAMPLLSQAEGLQPEPAGAEMITVNMVVNGKAQSVTLDSRVTLLDALRERMKLMGTKKGCDHGQCGACTVLVDDRRINACLHFAAMCEGSKVTTIEGLAAADRLHPMQEAFVKHDAYQCGYCTPGQICSAVGLVKEGKARTDAEIRESMSGNICRCGAYQHILNAIKDVQQHA